jgi:hypothetical protein
MLLNVLGSSHHMVDLDPAFARGRVIISSQYIWGSPMAGCGGQYSDDRDEVPDGIFLVLRPHACRFG